MRVLFLVEAGGSYGLGHLMRCEVLADVLRARQNEVVVAIRPGAGRLPNWSLGSGAVTFDDTAQAEALAATRHPDWVVVDGYGLMADGMVARLRSCGMRVLVFDDFSAHGGGADLVVNQNRNPELAESGPLGCLLGPKYSLVDASYRACRNRLVSPTIRRILVTFGGSDLHGMTPRVVAAFADVPGSLTLDVVIGPDHRVRALAQPAAHRVILHEQPHGLAPLVAAADLVISAAGSTCWQVCCAGVPLIAVQTANNQQEVVRTLRSSGCARTFELDAFASLLANGTLTQLIAELQAPSLRREMSVAQQELVDGDGAARIVAAMGL